MSPEELQRRLRLLPLGGSLTVKRDPQWAVAHGYHPDAYQVWDVGFVSNRPYCVIVIQDRRIDGVPVPLSDAVVKRIARAQQKSGFTPSMVDAVLRDEVERERLCAEDTDRRFQSIVDARTDGRERVFRAFGQGKLWGLNGSQLPCAPAKSSTSSATG